MYDVNICVANPLAVIGMCIGAVVGMAVLMSYIHTYVRRRMIRA